MRVYGSNRMRDLACSRRRFPCKYIRVQVLVAFMTELDHAPIGPGVVHDHTPLLCIGARGVAGRASALYVVLWVGLMESQTVLHPPLLRPCVTAYACSSSRLPSLI
jgi:hypothetical protein